MPCGFTGNEANKCNPMQSNAELTEKMSSTKSEVEEQTHILKQSMHISVGILGFSAAPASITHKESSPVPDSPRRYHNQSQKRDWICLPPPLQMGSLTYISNISSYNSICSASACREGEPGSLSVSQSGSAVLVQNTASPHPQ